MRPQSEALADMRIIIDELEKANDIVKRLNLRKHGLELELIEMHAQSGLDQMRTPELTVSFEEALRAKYDPAQWGQIIAWAASTGNNQLIQRRLSDTAVRELIEHGVPLPEGLTMESYTKVSMRRVNGR